MPTRRASCFEPSGEKSSISWYPLTASNWPSGEYATEVTTGGAADPKAGAAGTLYCLASDPRLNHESEVVRDVRAEECAALLTDFFVPKR